jgi:hypothetical protein
MDFPDALQACIWGQKITNENWNGKGMYVEVIPGSTNLFNETMLPYLEMTNAKGEKVPWLISQMDVFSTGWKTLGD